MNDQCGLCWTIQTTAICGCSFGYAKPGTKVLCLTNDLSQRPPTEVLIGPSVNDDFVLTSDVLRNFCNS